MENDIEPRLKEAREGNRTVYFADASHFVCGAFLGCLWCVARMFVPTSPGRQRYNVLGAINAISHDLACVCNETYVNALTVCDLLRIIREKHTDSNPITIVLDNAKYQCCNLVTQLAKTLDVELLFLPSYSPNLNLIERYWKWLKKDCLKCRYYENFTAFKEAIDESLRKTVERKNTDILPKVFSSTDWKPSQAYY